MTDTVIDPKDENQKRKCYCQVSPKLSPEEYFGQLSGWEAIPGTVCRALLALCCRATSWHIVLDIFGLPAPGPLLI